MAIIDHQIDDTSTLMKEGGVVRRNSGQKEYGGKADTG